MDTKQRKKGRGGKSVSGARDGSIKRGIGDRGDSKRGKETYGNGKKRKAHGSSEKERGTWRQWRQREGEGL